MTEIEKRPDADSDGPSLDTRRSVKRRISLADVEMYLRPFDWFNAVRRKIKHRKFLSRLRPRKKPKKCVEESPVSEELRQALSATSVSSLDSDLLPELSAESELITNEVKRALCKKIPARVEGHPWTLLFTTSEHGFSLKSLYRKTSEYEGPVILIVKDSEDQIFGAMCSNAIHPSRRYYGTGETFLFTFYPEFRAYPWSGENSYFLRGTKDGLEFGCGDGRYGLFLDEDLYHGRTQSCETFQNAPLTRAQDFLVQSVELWGLM